jgi:hypothetical protein
MLGSPEAEEELVIHYLEIPRAPASEGPGSGAAELAETRGGSLGTPAPAPALRRLAVPARAPLSPALRAYFEAYQQRLGEGR